MSTSTKKGVEGVKEYIELARERNWGGAPEDRDWDYLTVPRLRVVSHSPEGSTAHPWVVFRMRVEPDQCNPMGNLHGGAAATLFDACTSFALKMWPSTGPGLWQYMGVSRTLNVSYLRPIPRGTEIDLRAEVMQVGRRLATIRGTIRVASGEDGSTDDGALLATCEHGKVNTDPPAEKL